MGQKDHQIILGKWTDETFKLSVNPYNIIFPLLVHRVAVKLFPAPLMLTPMFLSDGTLLEGLPYYCAALTGYFSQLFFDNKLF